MEYAINAEITTVTTLTDMTIYCFGNLELNGIKLKLLSTYDTSSATVTATCNGVTSTDTKEFNSPIDGLFEFNVHVNAEENQNIVITVSRSRLNTIGGQFAADEKILKGLSAMLTGTAAFNCVLIATSTPIWRLIDDGYPELVSTEIVEFIDWDRDTDGYPINTTVWRIKNDVNDGFPFFFLLDEKPKITSRLYYNGEIVPLYYNGRQCSIFLKG